MTGFAFNLASAYVLDLVLGDPQGFPHPVRWIGRLIETGEKKVRSWIPSEFLGGALLTAGTILLAFFGVRWILAGAAAASAPLAAALETLVLYWCLSTKDLAVESRRVRDALKAGNLGEARKKLSWIVGRDTESLDEKEIVRAAVETVAENTVDGIVAPLFFAVLGGAPLAAAYKAINTLDSMIGHKNDKYILFGRVAAKVDTCANWLPARITGFLFPMAAALLKYSPKSSYRTAWAHASNSGIPEGAMAGALEIQLGGPNFYKGRAVDTPKMGEAVRPLSVENIDESLKVMYLSSLLFFAACALARIYLP